MLRKIKLSLEKIYESILPFFKTGSIESKQVSSFMKMVQNKAYHLGMVNSKFFNPSGIGARNVTSARDIMKLMIAASKNNVLCNVWSSKTKKLSVLGSNSRERIIETTLKDVAVEKAYFLGGGKTGSWSYINNVTAITEIHGKKVIGVVLGSYTELERFSALKELFDISSSIIMDEKYDKFSAKVVMAPSVISCVIKENGYEILFEQRADKRYLAASLTKVLTALTALDYIEELTDTFIIKTFDLIVDTHISFKAGDILTFEDGLYAMMLSSSNQVSSALARTIGESVNR